MSSDFHPGWRLQRWIGAFLAAIPMLAGLLFWMTLGGAFEQYKRLNEPPRKIRAEIDETGATVILVVLIVVVVLMHVGSFLLARWMGRRDRSIGLSGRAWTLAFGMAYLIGSTIGLMMVYSHSY